MDAVLKFLKDQWALFYIDPIDYALERGGRLIVMALGIWILLFCVRCAGGIVGL